ncbi:hypothetical protein ACFLY2_01825 [Patescibacteria group bacterium]
MVIDVNNPSDEVLALSVHIINNEFNLELEQSVFTYVDPWALPEDLTQLFAVDSKFTEKWNTNSCDVANMTIVDINP